MEDKAIKILFQFLNGAVRSVITYKGNTLYEKFQYLYGAIRIRNTELIDGILISFQSLYE